MWLQRIQQSVCLYWLFVQQKNFRPASGKPTNASGYNITLQATGVTSELKNCRVRWVNVNLFIFWSQPGLLRVQVRLWGQQWLSSFGKHYKNIPVCITLGFILASSPPLLSVTGMLQFTPKRLMLFVALMMVAATLCIAGKSLLVHIFVSALLPSVLFFFSFCPPLPPFPSDPSGRLPGSLGTSLEGFFRAELYLIWS